MPPDTKAAKPNPIVRGNRSCSGDTIPIKLMNSFAPENWNMRSGFVRTARNGRTAPMLRISANEAANIKIKRRNTWILRLFDI